METDKGLIQVMADLGFMAAGLQAREQADAIMSALTVLRPESERPYLIRAMARLARNELQEAEQVVREQALKQNPDSAIAKAYLGLILHEQKRMGERDRILDEVLAQDDDEAAANLARSLREAPAES